MAEIPRTIMPDVTQILSRIGGGDPSATEELLPLLYDELRRLAAQRLAHEKPGHTLEATALVHEAYLRLVDGSKAQHWNSRGHFFAAAAEAMRRILVENARRKKSVKAGGALHRVELEDVPVLFVSAPDDLLALDEALTKLESDDPQAAAVAKLRLFSGLSIEESASQLGVHRATAFRHWAYARAFLQLQLPESKGE
jgi:RNA polymerase sigma factor (TIGR02999 family)